MSSTDQNDAAEPSSEIELAEKVDWLRTQLDTVRQEAERSAMVKARQLGPLDDWVRVLADYDQLAQTLARTSFVPKDFQGKPDQITAGLMFGREIGIPPVTMMQNMVVIHGRVGMYAEQLRAMILAAGHEYEIEESTSDRCVITGKRKGSDRWQRFEYTMDRAKLAGLYAQNEQYRKRPTEMLLARASAIMAHAMFPDVIRGMGAIEELEAEAGEPDNAPVAPAAKATATVGRKKATPKALGTRAATSNEPAQAVGTPAPAIPDEPAIPPLPGEAGYDEPSAAATAESDAGVAAAAQSADGEPRVPAAPASTPGGAEVPPLPGEDDLPDPVEDMTDPQRGKLFALMTEQGLVEKSKQLEWISKNLRRELSSRSQVTKDDAKVLIDLLESLEETPRPVSRGDLRLVAGLFKELAITDTQERLHIASSIIGRTPMKGDEPSAEGMTSREANTLLQALGRCKNRDQVEALVQMAEQERAQGGGE